MRHTASKCLRYFLFQGETKANSYSFRQKTLLISTRIQIIVNLVSFTTNTRILWGKIYSFDREKFVIQYVLYPAKKYFKCQINDKIFPFILKFRQDAFENISTRPLKSYFWLTVQSLNNNSRPWRIEVSKTEQSSPVQQTYHKNIRLKKSLSQ